ncbi:MAG: glycosyl hydrolase [Thermoguttaceae bacterium]
MLHPRCACRLPRCMNRNSVLGFIACLTLLAAPAVAAEPSADSRLFHKPGLIYFWALNDACTDAKIDAMIDAFAKGCVSAVCLHPRSGLLKPYGGQAWFDFIQRTVDRCAARGLDVWLYDEDPFPSGNCGGWVTMEHPEYRAMAIHRVVPVEAPERKGLYCFAPGTLLWCGWVNEESGKTIDLTARVGLVRRRWIKLDPWDSRNYYPATPLYPCVRAWTKDPEYAVETGEAPPGFKLLAFVAQPAGSEQWPDEPDRLNAEATRLFLERTHERYAAVVGDRFGKQIKAIFSDEPKYDGTFPWTRAMFAAFKRQFGYDLPPRLWQLFAPTTDPQSMLTRLDYRQWCGERFRSAWLDPISQWCKDHRLALVGHISPEDDPVQQNQCLSNLFPAFRSFAVPGFDLIIPAVGDHKNPLINIGVLSATSAAQQLDKPGVLNEVLACSGLDFTAKQAGRILRWELMMGVTTPVVHCAYNSTEGLRLIDAPPDFGPESSRWEEMVKLGRELGQLQDVVRDVRQIAPVAILWPIRSFAVQPPTDFRADSPLRNELVRVIQQCLDRQVGVHLLDEADLWRSTVVDRELRLGKARYSHVILAGCSVVHENTIVKLRSATQAGVTVLRVGRGPQWQQNQASVEPMRLDWCPGGEAAEVVGRLPRLVDLGPDGTDIRCTAWQHGDRCTRLLMNLGNKPVDVTIGRKQSVLTPGEVAVLSE